MLQNIKPKEIDVGYIYSYKFNDQNYKLKKGCSLLVDVTDKKIVTIRSNCLFLRPTVFSYKNDFLDVHHS